MRKYSLIIGMIAWFGLSVSCITTARTNTISIHNEGLYPEGISFDQQRKVFYVSSVSRGEIWQVDEHGENELFAKNDKFASTIGLQVDNNLNRLLVCIADPGVGKNTDKKTAGKLAGLAVYDLNTKKEVGYYELTPANDNKGHFANDVTVDDKGNSYVTDSFAPIVYKVDPQGKVGILGKYPELPLAVGKFGLNGIVFHPEGFLIVAHYDSGKLFKIDLNKPAVIKEIVYQTKNPQWKATGLDGLLLLDDKTLIAVNNDSSGREKGNFVLQLTSENHWDSATMTGVMPTTNSFPTTLTRKGEDVFVIHARLDSLFSGKPAEKTFNIEKVIFDK